MDFVAIDVETANPDIASICQIGIVCFDNGSIVDEWQSMVDPEDYFDRWNTSIHGITSIDIHGAPKLPQLFPDLRLRLEGRIVACHSLFDRLALSRATLKYGLPDLTCSWLDTTKVVRRTWAEYSRRGYGLANIAKLLGISFDHHVAVEDARVAGEILHHAIAQTGLSVQDWLLRVQLPISSGNAHRVAREGNPDGPLWGEVIVFTGSLSISRREAAALAAQAGCTVADSVNGYTTILVVGHQNAGQLSGRSKSSKQRKAEELLGRGQPIRILKESDFVCLVGLE